MNLPAVTPNGPAWVLNEAARLMRETTRPVGRGPWAVREAHGHEESGDWDETCVTAPSGDICVTHLTGVIEGGRGAANAAYIKTMHPPLAMALASLLGNRAEAAATALGIDVPEGPCCAEPRTCQGHDPEWGCGTCGQSIESDSCACGWREALAVAWTILGTRETTGT